MFGGQTEGVDTQWVWLHCGCGHRVGVVRQCLWTHSGCGHSGCGHTVGVDTQWVWIQNVWCTHSECVHKRVKQVLCQG